MKRLHRTKLTLLVLGIFGSLALPCAARTGVKAQFEMSAKTTLTIHPDGGSVYVVEAYFSNPLLNIFLPCEEVRKSPPFPGATTRDSIRRDDAGHCISTTTVEFANLRTLANFLEKKGGYLQEQGDKIAVGLNERPANPSPNLRGLIKLSIQLPVIDKYDPSDGKRTSVPGGDQVLWQYRSEPEIQRVEVLGRLGESQCEVEPLPSIDDEETRELENDPQAGLRRLAPDITASLNCLKVAVAGEGKQLVVTSTFRTEAYQRHFSDIWKKWQALQNNTNPACSGVRRQVQQEITKHQLVHKPAKLLPQHTRGQAFDVSFSKTGLSSQRVVDLARSCSLYRPDPTDRVHFERIGNRNTH